MDWQNWKPKRGDVYYADLGKGIDSEQSGIRPVVIIQNDVGNSFSPLVVVVPITSKKKFIHQLHVLIGKEFGLKVDSYAMAEQIVTISKRKFFINNQEPKRVTSLTHRKMMEIQDAINFELGFNNVDNEVFDEEKAFKMIDYIRILKYNIEVKKAKGLLLLYKEIKNDFIKYCQKHNKNYNTIVRLYNNSKEQTCV